MFRRVTFGLEGTRSVAIVAGFGAGMGYLLTLRLTTEELALFFLLYEASELSVYAFAFLRIALFHRVLPPGVRLTLILLPKRCPHRGSSVMDSIRMSVLVGPVLFTRMELTHSPDRPV